MGKSNSQPKIVNNFNNSPLAIWCAFLVFAFFSSLLFQSWPFFHFYRFIQWLGASALRVQNVISNFLLLKVKSVGEKRYAPRMYSSGIWIHFFGLLVSLNGENSHTHTCIVHSICMCARFGALSIRQRAFIRCINVTTYRLTCTIICYLLCFGFVISQYFLHTTASLF